MHVSIKIYLLRSTKSSIINRTCSVSSPSPSFQGLDKSILCSIKGLEHLTTESIYVMMLTKLADTN